MGVDNSIRSTHARCADTGSDRSVQVTRTHKNTSKQVSAETVADLLRTTQAALNASERRYQIVAQIVQDAIILIDTDGQIEYVNTAAITLFGHTIAEMLGHSVTLIMPEYLQHARASTASPEARIALQGLHKDGRSLSLTAWFDHYQQGDKLCYAGIVHDISERRFSEERVRELAQYGALTGLPNRILFHDRICQAIAHAERNQQSVAVLFLDLDGFKHVNDSLGHQCGDSLLCEVSKRLLTCVRAEDSVGRIGGDEFVIGLPMQIDYNAAASIANKILDAIRQPFFVNENALHLSTSIGVALYPKDGETAAMLMKAADSAMYHAKKNGRNNCQFFTPSLNELARRRLAIANGLHQAIERHELVLDYQPQVDLQDGRIFAAEALLRWRHPDLGWVPTTEFVKVAEETDLITPIGEWVLRNACRQLAIWRRAGFPDLRLAVNLSPGQFRCSNFVERVRGILHDAGLPAVALDLEITEAVLMFQSNENIAMLTQLAGMGVQLSVDDFGTAYSSFAYLKRFPIDCVKIDHSFVGGVLDNANDVAIVTAIIAMAKSLHLTVVAEGVETLGQVDFLRSCGCLAAQGRYFHKAIRGQQFHQLLKNQQSWHLHV